MKDHRRRFHRAKDALYQNEGEGLEQQYHAHYFTVVRSWLFDLHAVLKSAAERGVEPIEELWYDSEFGDHSGLQEVGERFMRVTPDDLPPSGVIEEVGKAVEQTCVTQLDLPEQPPVVEPWSPSERRDPEELFDELGFTEAEKREYINDYE